jgi:hypothetical protein
MFVYLSTFFGLEYYIRVHVLKTKNIKYIPNSIIYRLWLLLLNLIIITISGSMVSSSVSSLYNKTIDFNYCIEIFNRYNNYPIFLIYSGIFYYICRHCLRNQILYMHMIHLYHPCQENEIYGTYYRGIRYSLIDAFIKYFIICFFLKYNGFFISLFLLTTDIIDLYFYYQGKTDSTPVIFQTISQYLYSRIQLKSN